MVLVSSVSAQRLRCLRASGTLKGAALLLLAEDEQADERYSQENEADKPLRHASSPFGVSDAHEIYLRQLIEIADVLIEQRDFV